MAKVISRPRSSRLTGRTWGGKRNAAHLDGSPSRKVKN